MLMDLTYRLKKEDLATFLAKNGERNLMALGHVGTHFDAMDKDFPLEYGESRGIVFDVSRVTGREIAVADIDIAKVQAGDAVLFYTGIIEKFSYGSKEYFHEHPELSWELIQALVEKGIRIIGVDMCGVRKAAEHPKADQYCADLGTFVIENLVHLGELLQRAEGKAVHLHIYPLNIEGYSGMPSRVAAEFLTN